MADAAACASRPRSVLHWCGACRGRQAHILIPNITPRTRGGGLYSCAGGCGSLATHLSDPASKTPGVLLAAEIFSAAATRALRRDVERGEERVRKYRRRVMAHHRKKGGRIEGRIRAGHRRSRAR